MEAATLGVPVMACDVSGCHSFLKKLRRAFARRFRGRTPARHAVIRRRQSTATKYRCRTHQHTSAAQVEALIAGDIHISPQN